ncbi:MAG: hypothetical protein V2J12_05295 [Gammaproteobacteria bacterium]|jgi:hypothetical protein|nr:hypothetical protein [Gammaproteobacteria bacterium]
MLRKAISVMLAFGFLAGASSAETLIIEGIQDEATTRPDRGATQDEVIREFGEPVQRLGPVGEPPISTWEYAPFVVYFEYDKVVHTVAKR